MPKINLNHNPSLTKESLLEILKKHFITKGYEVGYSKLIGTHLYIQKNGWVGATIRLVQRDNATFLRVGGYAPSAAVRLLLYGLITYLILAPKWKRLINEISEFVANSKEL